MGPAKLRSGPSKPRSLSWARRLRILRDERGTASTETVMMMPAFIIIWGSVFFVFQGARKIVEMNVRIREDAWTRAYGSCSSDPSGTTYSASSSGSSTTGDVPVFGGAILDMMFTEFYAQRQTSQAAPPILGGRTKNYRGEHLWICNENPEDYSLTNTISEVWSMFGVGG